MARLDLKRGLVMRNWEDALLAVRPIVKRNGGAAVFSKDVVSEGLILDLSRVGWVEPDSALRAVLMAEAALLAGASVEARLPLGRPSLKEAHILEQANRASASVEDRRLASYVSATVTRRREAAAMLTQLRFAESLLPEHLADRKAQLKVDASFDWCVGDGGSAQSASLQESVDIAREHDPSLGLDSPEIHYAYPSVLFPLTWVSYPRTADGRTSLETLANIDTLSRVLTRGPRVQACDTDTLIHVFAKELAENVEIHAGCSHALLTAWFRPAYAPRKPHEVLEAEEPFRIWCLRYSTIEMTVGDSGVGVPAVLRKNWNKMVGKSAALSSSGWTDDDQVMSWAFDKWSTSKEERNGESRGTRGLWRVKRVVEKYAGCVTLRSESSLVGWDFGGINPQDARPKETRLCQSPYRKLARALGTVVQVIVPVIPVEKILEAALCRKLDPPQLGSPVYFPEDSSIEDIAAALEKQCSVTPGQSVVADLAFRVFAPDDLKRLLYCLAVVSHPVLVVVINASLEQGTDTLEGVIESITTQGLRAFQGPTEKGDPLLFRRPDGTYAWVGLPEGADARLYDKFLTDGRLGADELQGLDADVRQGVILQLLECSHAFLPVGSKPDIDFELVFSPNALDTRIRELECCDALRQAISREIDAFSETEYLYHMPSTEIVERYIRFDALIDYLDKRALKGVSLGRLCAGLAALTRAQVESEQSSETPSWQWPGKTVVVADMRVPWRLVEGYRSYLRQQLSAYRSTVLLMRLGPGDPSDLPSDSLIIVLADIVRSEGTVKRLISQIADSGRLPDAVVAVIDGRTHGRAGVRVNRDHSIPLFALCEVDMTPCTTGPAKPPRFISPDLTVEDDIPARPLGTGRADSLVDSWVKSTGAAYSGHIVQPRGRHLPWYVDAHRMMDKTNPGIAPPAQEIISEFCEVVDSWRNGQPVDAVCFPPSRTSSASRQIALEVAKSLSRAGLPEPRIEAIDAGWSPTRIPQAPLHPQDCEMPLLQDKPICLERAVIVDWGSVTGATLRRLVRALAPVSRRILAVVLLSQAPIDEDLFLRDVAVVRGGLETTEVTVMFLARLRVPVYDTANCPHCQQLARLDAEERFYPTDLLRDYASELRNDELAPQGLLAVRAEAQYDPVESEDIMAILRLRDLVDRAEFSTRSRFELLHRVTELMSYGDSTDFDRRRLLRLLATEWTLLTRLPLGLPVFREMVAGIATEAIRSDSDKRTRRFGVVVLRTASKARFAEAFPDLLDKACVVEGLVGEDFAGAQPLTAQLTIQLLYCAFTMLQGSYRLPQVTSPLVQSLKQAQENLGAKLLESPLRVAHRVARTLGTLRDYGLAQQAYLTQAHVPEVQRRMAGWRELRLQLDPLLEVGGSPSASRLIWSMDFDTPTESRYRSQSSSEWSTWLARWVAVSQKLFEGPAFKVLYELREIVPYLEMDAQSLEWLAAPEKGFLTCVSSLTHHLGRFATDPDAARDDTLWRKFKDARNRLWRYAFDPGLPDASDPTGFSGSCVLARLIRGCPVKLDAFTGPKPQVPLQYDGVAPEVQVFCHYELLQRVVRAAISGQRSPQVLFSSREGSPGRVRLLIRGAAPDCLQALAAYRRGLEAFGVVQEPSTDATTVDLLFRKWE